MGLVAEAGFEPTTFGLIRSKNRNNACRCLAMSGVSETRWNSNIYNAQR